MDPIRFGIIGFGTQGRTYCHLLAGTSPYPGLPPRKQPQGCSLGAVCTRSPEKQDMIRTQLPGVPVFSDYREMLASGCCDAVIPTVPHFQHRDMTIAALEAGIPVLCEKPAAVRASDARAMAEAAEKSGIPLGIFFNQRTNPLYQRVRQLIASGELGGIRRSSWTVTSWWRPDSYYRQNPWRGTWAGEGGGVLVNQAPHQLDLWLWLCGAPVEVFAMARQGAYRDIATENDVTILTRYENGATGAFTTCTHDPLGVDRLEIQLDGGRILVENGRKCTISRLIKDGRCVTEDELNRSLTMGQLAALTAANGSGSLSREEVFEGDGGWGIQHGLVMENFAAHLRQGAPLLADGRDGLGQVQLANAAQLSAWENRPLPFPCREEDYDQALACRIARERP